MNLYFKRKLAPPKFALGLRFKTTIYIDQKRLSLKKLDLLFI